MLSLVGPVPLVLLALHALSTFAFSITTFAANSHHSLLTISSSKSLQGRRLRSQCAFKPKKKLTDMQLMLGRRIPIIVASTTNASDIPAWLSTLDDTGKWPASEIDYTTGCDAQRANWPAQYHWLRINTLAAVWQSGVNGTTQYYRNPNLLQALSKAIDWWFSRDFQNPACLDSGGTDTCPCGTPGMWNTNWFSNIDLIPTLVVEACLLLSDVLTDTQHANCSHIGLRSYGTFGHSVNGAGVLTGANTLDVANIGVDVGLLNDNESIIVDAYQRAHNEIVVQNAVHADGIRPDGSFGQHAGLLYNGNYGKDYINDVLKLEAIAADTVFEANNSAKQAVASLLDGSSWMIFLNTLTKVEHWDFSVLPRFISFPVIDAQATANININISRVNDLGKAWDSPQLIDFFDSLSQASSSANVGGRKGSRAFWNNDYLVQRGLNHVTTVKGYSSRTLNTECTNSQNPFGFHLSDGATLTYVQGNEYEDIAAAWDWNLIPGTTVDYNATILSCDKARFTGLESFVGGISAGTIGAFAMKFTNPSTKNLHWQKSWFFYDNDVQHVIISNLTSKSEQPVFSVLDQKLHSGNVYVDGNQVTSSNFTSFTSLWHSNVGYTFDTSVRNSTELVLRVGTQSGAWSAIGTSKQPPETVDLFTAMLQHTNLQNVVSYTVYPGIQLAQFNQQIEQETLLTLTADANVHAVLDTKSNVLMVVFWSSNGGQVTNTRSSPQYQLSADHACIIIVSQSTWNISLADPSQLLTSVEVDLGLISGDTPAAWGGERNKSLSYNLPTGGLAGQTVSQALH